MSSASTLGVPAHDLAGLALLGKTALALGLVAACILSCGWLVSRFGARPSPAGALVRVVSSTRVGQREKVVVVDVGERRLVLGVTAQQVTRLAQMPAPEQADEQQQAPRGFALRLADALKRGGVRDPGSQP